jgi:hypothetical protein
MKQSSPPRAAVWMLRHLTPGERNDALAGDLLEEFRSGRSAAWYWRQVLACVAISNRRVAVAHTAALLFAGFWALLVPAWLPITRLGHFPRLNHAFLSLAWPWSTLCVLMFTFSLLISFVWAGLLLYLLLESMTSTGFSFRRFRRGMMRSAAVFAPVFLATMSLPLILHGLFAVHISGYELRALHFSSFSVNNPYALSMLAKPVLFVTCAPFFITLLWAIWDASRVKSTRKHQ